jgi:methyl-accepting chemotaxis protein
VILLLLTSGFVLTYQFFALSGFRDEVVSKSALIQKKGAYLNEILRTVGYNGIIHNLKDYLIFGDQKNRERMKELTTKLFQATAKYRLNENQATEREIQLITIINRVFERYGNYDDEITSLLSNDTPQLEIALTISEKELPENLPDNQFTQQDAAEALEELNLLFLADTQALEKSLNEGISRNLFELFLGLLISLILNGIMLAVTIRSITKNLKVMGKTAKNLAKGDLKSRVEIRTKDALGSLGKSFNKAMNRLSEMLQYVHKNLQENGMQNRTLVSHLKENILSSTNLFQKSKSIMLNSRTLT